MKTAEQGVKLLDASGTGEVLGVQERVVRELWRTGIIPGIKVTRQAVRFSLADVISALKERSDDEWLPINETGRRNLSGLGGQFLMNNDDLLSKNHLALILAALQA
jgi:hypothetical protein